MKTLIITTRLDKRGGVSNFYRMLQPHFDSMVSIYQKHQSSHYPIKVLLSLYDYICFTLTLICNKYDCYLLNPSLVERAVVRDMFYAATVRIFHKKLVVFFHGWKLDFQNKIEKKSYFRLFKKSLCNADLTFVLSKEFKEKLIQWGNNKKIEVAFTCYEQSIVDEKRESVFPFPIRILYLSRVEEAKGIFIVLKAFKILQESNPGMFSLTIAGDGNALNAAKKHVEDNKISAVTFLGYIRGEEKKACINTHQVFFFPSYSEGLPCALLEAMACGLVVVTRSVGGIPGFFTPGMGFSTDSMDPNVFAKAILEFSHNPEKMKHISSFNRQYASKNFSASKVAKRMMNYIYALENTQSNCQNA